MRSYRFSHKGWLVTLAELTIARSGLRVDWKREKLHAVYATLWFLFPCSYTRGEISRFPFPGDTETSFGVDYWISNIKP